LADFGFSAEANSRSVKYSDGSGTSCYRAPELISDNPSYTNKADVWSMGCILYELAVGRRAFSSEGLVFKPLEIELDKHVSDSCKGFIRTDLDQMLAIEPRLRPSAITLRETFKRHFEITELHDHAVESHPIATAPPSPPEVRKGIRSHTLIDPNRDWKPSRTLKYPGIV
jgi:serine/threonine protein kinase